MGGTYEVDGDAVAWLDWVFDFGDGVGGGGVEVQTG